MERIKTLAEKVQTIFDCTQPKTLDIFQQRLAMELSSLNRGNMTQLSVDQEGIVSMVIKIWDDRVPSTIEMKELVSYLRQENPKDLKSLNNALAEFTKSYRHACLLASKVGFAYKYKEKNTSDSGSHKRHRDDGNKFEQQVKKNKTGNDVHNGCGRTHNNHEGCFFKNHPNYNKHPTLPWKDSIQGKAWAEKKIYQLPDD